MEYVKKKFKNGTERGYIRFMSGKFIRLTTQENTEFKEYLAKRKIKS